MIEYTVRLSSIESVLCGAVQSIAARTRLVIAHGLNPVLPLICIYIRVVVNKTSTANADPKSAATNH